MFFLRDLPKYEALRQRAERYPEIDPAAVKTYLVMQRVATDIMTAMETFFARNSVSAGRFAVLMILNRQPDAPMSPSDIASKCGVTRATMTGLLDCLERDGMIRREPDPTDRRMSLVRLTPAAIQFLDGLCPEYYRRLAGLMGKLTEQDKFHLEEMLRKINENIPLITQP